ncbi:MAG: hypothetical protein FWC97_02345 [Treponema sp.]|nr:hypothetical protein [Treponema sp.]
MKFDVNKYARCFEIEPDEACFWHGRTDGIGDEANAKSIAEEKVLKTLEMKLLEHREELETGGVEFELEDGAITIKYGTTKLEEQEFWDACSKSFAEQAAGQIHVIEGTDLRRDGASEHEYAQSVWARIERRILAEKLTDPHNREVSDIMAIDPATGNEKGLINKDIIKQELLSDKNQHIKLSKRISEETDSESLSSLKSQQNETEIQYKTLKINAVRAGFFSEHELDGALKSPMPSSPAEQLLIIESEHYLNKITPDDYKEITGHEMEVDRESGLEIER